MTTDEAFEIVLDLARQNVIEDSEVRQDEEVLQPMQDQQNEACAMVENFFVNHVAE